MVVVSVRTIIGLLFHWFGFEEWFCFVFRASYCRNSLRFFIKWIFEFGAGNSGVLQLEGPEPSTLSNDWQLTHQAVHHGVWIAFYTIQDDQLIVPDTLC